MSLTFTLTARSSFLSFNFHPPIYLDGDPTIEYGIGLANFDTFNMVPNNNIFVWGEKSGNKVEISAGSYELEHLIETLTEKMMKL